jgi:hypothetical protein
MILPKYILPKYILLKSSRNNIMIMTCHFAYIQLKLKVILPKSILPESSW